MLGYTTLYRYYWVVFHSLGQSMTLSPVLRPADAALPELAGVGFLCQFPFCA
ncbi:hypothetical protein ACFOEK_17410 [Litoribrevibacter euphylliae]|uniref:Uncharacterized protein n=1 Tax=Litoribrevibacter euphylliae TaxID=1834034 RepID=A0ABV7HG06_9GAMM